MGYYRAGFEDITGVDIKPQPNYPFSFVQGDALEYVTEHGTEFDVIHASPPCQAYSTTSALPWVDDYPELIEPLRKLLQAFGKPYVIENVPGAPLINPLELCGSMFELSLIRHRLFEIDPPIYFPPGPHACSHLFTNSNRGYSSFNKGATAITVAGKNYPLADGKVAMGIDWMTNRDELSEAIPPAYTEFIGRRIMETGSVKLA
jgi:DNA (cytosine-5)-methyltransferase 1